MGGGGYFSCVGTQEERVVIAHKKQLANFKGRAGWEGSETSNSDRNTQISLSLSIHPALPDSLLPPHPLGVFTRPSTRLPDPLALLFFF